MPVWRRAACRVKPQPPGTVTAERMRFAGGRIFHLELSCLDNNSFKHVKKKEGPRVGAVLAWDMVL